MDVDDLNLQFIHEVTVQQTTDIQNRMFRAVLMLLIAKGVATGDEVHMAITTSAGDADEAVFQIMESLAAPYLGLEKSHSK